MLANNETGAIQPVAELADLAEGRGVPVHTDAVQAVGRITVDFHALGVATLASSAHKFHGPGGIGLLLVRKEVKLAPRTFGGGQQGGATTGHTLGGPGRGTGDGPGALAGRGRDSGRSVVEAGGSAGVGLAGGARAGSGRAERAGRGRVEAPAGRSTSASRGSTATLS